MKIEDFEYSAKAAADSARRTFDPAAAERLRKAQAESRRLAHQISKDIQARNQPIETEEDLAKALLKLQSATGLKIGLERRKKRN